MQNAQFQVQRRMIQRGLKGEMQHIIYVQNMAKLLADKIDHSMKVV